MKANVIVPFTDLKTGKIYLVGDMYSGSADRIAELAEKGHVEPPASKEPEKTATKK